MSGGTRSGTKSVGVGEQPGSPRSDPLQPERGWAQSLGPRIPLPPAAARGLLFRAAAQVSRWFGRPQLPNVFPVFHVNARLFWPWLFFASRLMPFGRLPARTREKLILRTAWNCRSRYEWAQHLEIGLRVGVADDEVLALARGPQAMTDALDALLVRACDALCRDEPVDEGTWAGLARQFDARRMIEIVVLVGHYRMVAGFLVNADVAVEEDVERVLAAFHARVADRL